MKKRRQYTGVVISDKMQKTRIVKITRLSKHPKYKKIIKQTSKFKAHDEKNISKSGDKVRVEETRPLSKDKRYRILEIIEKKSTLADIKEEQI